VKASTTEWSTKTRRPRGCNRGAGAAGAGRLRSRPPSTWQPRMSSGLRWMCACACGTPRSALDPYPCVSTAWHGSARHGSAWHGRHCMATHGLLLGRCMLMPTSVCVWGGCGSACSCPRVYVCGVAVAGQGGAAAGRRVANTLCRCCKHPERPPAPATGPAPHQSWCTRQAHAAPQQQSPAS